MQDARPKTHALHEVGLHVPPLEVDEPELLDPPGIVHEPPMHIPPDSVQSAQLPLPGWPHAMSAVPAWHARFESQQPLGQSHVAAPELEVDPLLPEALPELPPVEPELALEPPEDGAPLLLELALGAPSSGPPSNAPMAPLHPQTTAQASKKVTRANAIRSCFAIDRLPPSASLALRHPAERSTRGAADQDRGERAHFPAFPGELSAHETRVRCALPGFAPTVLVERLFERASSPCG